MLVSQVINEETAVRSSIESRSKRLVAFLAGCVPYLELDPLAIVCLDDLLQEVNSDRVNITGQKFLKMVGRISRILDSIECVT